MTTTPYLKASPDIARGWIASLDARLWTIPEFADHQRVEAGVCDDCQRSQPVRLVYGRVIVCRPCLRRRARVAHDLDLQPPPPLSDEP